MKKFLFLAVILSSQVFAQNAQIDLVICEGESNGETITMLDDGFKVGILKGKVDVAAGARGNSIPKAIFTNAEAKFSELGDDVCELKVEGSQGSFSVQVGCEGSGAGKLSATIPSLSLEVADVAVECRKEKYGQSPSAQ